MNSDSSNNSQNSVSKNFKFPPLLGCCAGQALGCGFSFLASWMVAWILSVLLVPLFGQYQGENTTAGVLLSGLTCCGSLILAAGFSFLTGRLFPVFKKTGSKI